MLSSQVFRDTESPILPSIIRLASSVFLSSTIHFALTRYSTRGDCWPSLHRLLNLRFWATSMKLCKRSTIS
ncbi:hypothetical protein H6P81_011088 [Aristolochia fimbriata]|uniref:Uncharacterized protein n=1 Tax=Aristolochia fimbriata TaxID=158543 RepID=A0AAV7EQV7_ARIFI|nr:hypothetical protein H6P81_011088 [Aristolochia fimbriata]